MAALVRRASPPTRGTRKHARHVMISREPRVIAFCADVADVMAALHFGRDMESLSDSD
jgi:hypothetical protein